MTSWRAARFRTTRFRIAECRNYFAEFVPLQRDVEAIGKQSEDGKWLSAGPEERETSAQLANAMERQLECEWQIEVLQNRLKLAIGTAAGIEGLVSWQTNEPSDCFDLERFKEEHRDLFDEYQKPRALVRPFKLIMVGDRTSEDRQSV